MKRFHTKLPHYVEVMYLYIRSNIDAHARLAQDGTILYSVFIAPKEPRKECVARPAESKRIFEDLYGDSRKRWETSPAFHSASTTHRQGKYATIASLKQEYCP